MQKIAMIDNFNDLHGLENGVTYHTIMRERVGR